MATFLSKLTVDKNIKIIGSVDDLCLETTCPYISFCLEKNYAGVVDQMKQILDNYRYTSEILDFLNSSGNPDQADEFDLKKFNLEYGEIYKFGNIKG